MQERGWEGAREECQAGDRLASAKGDSKVNGEGGKVVQVLMDRVN